MEQCWDVAVVGAGPAGSAAALAARRAWPAARVLLLDRAEFPRDKACGDGVAPHVFDVLARLGVTGVQRGVPVRRLRLGFAGGPQVVGVMARPAHVMPRSVLDERLVAAAVDGGATLARGRVRAVQATSDGVLISLADDDRPVLARVLIGADGAHSQVRAALGLPSPSGSDLAFALRGYAPVSAGREREQVIVFGQDGAWPSYAWSFPIGDGRANVGYGEGLRANGPPTSRSALLARLDALLPGAAEGGGDWRGQHLPLSTGRARQPDGAVLLAGDALGLVNPLTGEGIHAAVLSGALAGLAAARAARAAPAAAAADRRASAGRAYRLALRSAFGRHHRHLGLVARLGHRQLGDRRALVAVGVRACARDGRVFDDLVEMGLADGGLTPRVLFGVAAAIGLRT